MICITMQGIGLMIFKIIYTIRGPGGTVQVPNTSLVKAENLASLLELLSKNLPQPFGCQCIGINIKEVEKDD